MKIRRIDFYPDDWITGTVGLHADEIGVYITICALIYAHGGPVAIEVVKSWCSAHGNAFNRIMGRLEILGKIIRKGSEIDQKRCENELERARNRLRKSSENGAKGNEIRWNRVAIRSGVAIANKQHTTTIKKESDSETLTSLPTDSDSKNPKHTIGAKSGISRRVYVKDFERFWKEYPHRPADPKKPAADKFAVKVKGGADPEAIIAGAARYTAHVSEQKLERQFIPQAATWLNQERWTDEPDTYANGKCLPFADGPTGPPPTTGEYFDRN